MKKIAFGLLTIAVLLSGAQSADSHSQMTSSFPIKDQTVKVLPSIVWVDFNGEMLSLAESRINRITVTNVKKIRVDTGGSVIKGVRISTKLKPGLAEGKYQVSYRVVSEDGHPVEGSFFFSYRSK